MDFRWNQWNVEHLANRGIDPQEAQDVIVQASGPYPRRIGDDKLLVGGLDAEGVCCRSFLSSTMTERSW